MFYDALLGFFIGVMLTAFIFQSTISASARKKKHWPDGLGRWYEIKKINIRDKL